MRFVCMGLKEMRNDRCWMIYGREEEEDEG